MKKILSFILCFNLVFNFFCFSSIEVCADTGYVASAISRIREIQNTYPVGSRFTGSFNGAIQCKGFADYVYYNMFGLYCPAYTSSKNTLVHNGNINVVGEITSRPTESQLRDMFSKGRTGDIIQGNKQSSQHTMVFMYATNDGIHVYDCNSDGNCTVKERDLSYSEIAGDGYYTGYIYGISLYTAPNYTEKFADTSVNIGSPVDVGSDFYAEIMNKKSWLFLQNDNLNVNIQHRTGYPEQVWHFERQGDGSYKITSALDGKCLDVTSGSSASGANVGVYEDNGSDAQRWYIYGELDHYQLKAKCGNCVLDVKNGNFSIGENIQMWEYNGSDAQKFQIDKVAEPPVNLGDNFYAEIMNKKSWLFLQNDNLNVNIQHRTGYPEQVWHFERQGDGSYKITSALDGKCLDVNNMLPDAGTNVKVYEDNGTSAQRWYIYGPLDHYQLKAGCGNCVLDVKNGNFSIGENIQMWEYNGSDAQKFQIDKVAEPPVNLGDNFNALIINKKSWLHLENDNTNVIIRKGTGYLQQVWHFERQVDGGYKIISTLDGKCLDVNNMLPDAGTNVKVYEDNGTSAQRWYIYGPLDHYQLKAGCGNCVLDIENGNLSVGANVQMWDFNDTDAQKFHIWKVDKIAEDIGDNFVASIRSTESGLPLTVNDSNQVVLASSESSSKQLWKFSRLENGSYTIQSAYDGKLFSVESDEDSDKDLRILALNNVGGNNQYWKFYKNDQGYFLKPTSSSRFLDINDANFTEGNYLQIYNKSENDLNLKAQKFSVYKSDDVQLFAPTLKVAADGSNAKFTWNDVNGETGYNLTIYDSSSKANVKNNVSSGTSYSLSAGKYTAKVEAYNYFETKQSNTVEFEIKSGEIPTPLPTLRPTTPPQYSSTVTVGSVSGIPGGEVTVPVRIKNNPGISSFTFKLNYDKSKLTPVSITKMGGMPGSLTSNIQQSGIDLTKLDYVTAVWSNETDYSESGEMFSVKFKVSESVPTGEDIPIQISYTKGNIIDRNYNDVDVNLVDGAVSTAQVKYGDIYKDGEINNKDLVRLRQYLAEWDIQLTEDEYKAADVFRDGTVNNKDLVRLSQYLAEWDVRLGE